MGNTWIIFILQPTSDRVKHLRPKSFGRDNGVAAGFAGNARRAALPAFTKVSRFFIKPRRARRQGHGRGQGHQHRELWGALGAGRDPRPEDFPVLVPLSPRW